MDPAGNYSKVNDFLQNNDYKRLIQKFKNLSKADRKVLSKFFDEWKSNASIAHPQENTLTLTHEQQASLTNICKILDKAESAEPRQKSRLKSIAKGVRNLIFGRISSDRLAIEAILAKTKIGNKAKAESAAVKIENQTAPVVKSTLPDKPQPKFQSMRPISPESQLQSQQPPIPQPSLQPAKPQQSMQQEPQLKYRPSQDEEGQQLELAPLPPGPPPNRAVIQKDPHSLLTTECAHTKALLTKMGNRDYALNVKNGMVVLSKHEPQKEITSTDIEVIFRYFNQNLETFHQREAPHLNAIKEKMLSSTTDETVKQEILKKFEEHAQSALISSMHPPAAYNPQFTVFNKEVRVVLEVAPPPKNREEFLQNLDLYTEHFPRYQFDNHLALFDTTFSFPTDLNPPIVFKKMRSELEKLKDEPTIQSNPQFAERIDFVLENLKPKKIVNFTIIIESKGNQDKTATLTALDSALREGAPIVLNKELKDQLVKSDLERFHYAAYSQEPGDLILLIPMYKTTLKSLGFNEVGLKPMDYSPVGADQSAEEKKAEKASPGFAHDIENLLLKETEDFGFHRVVAWVGHGISATESPKSAKITGLSIPDFQKGLEVLRNKNLKFLLLNSCYSGGANLSEIKAPVPTIVQNSTEIPSFATRNPPFTFIQKQLYHMTRDGWVLRDLPLTESKLQMIARKVGSELETNELDIEMGKRAQMHNLPTILLPTSTADLPQVPVSFKSSQFLNVRDQIKQHPANDEVIDTLGPNDKGFFLFTDPVNPIKLTSEESKGRALFSRGGNAHHVITELNLPNMELQSLAEQTFNVFLEAGPIKDLSSKCFAIGQMTCKVKGKEVKLENVFIMKLGDLRYVAYKNPGEGLYTFLHFKKVPGNEEEEVDRWEFGEERLSLEKDSFNYLFECVMFASSSSRDKENAFYEGLNTLFWKGQPPIQSQLLGGLFSSQNIFSRNAEGQTVKGLSAFDTALLAMTKPSEIDRNRVFLEAVRGHCSKFKMDRFADKISKALS